MIFTLAFALASMAFGTVEPGRPLAAFKSQFEAGDRVELERLNTLWLRSYETRDPAGLSAILAEEFIGLYGDSTLSKKDMLERLATRPPTRVSWENLTITVNGNSAVVGAVSTIATGEPAKPTVARYRYADVYVRREDGWKAIASHVVRLPD
jgi:hypothetical protein